MKREFLQNLGDFSKETVDAIMAENGRDIEKAKAPYADFETMKKRLEELEQKQFDFDALGQKAADWEKKYNLSQLEYDKKLGQLKFQQALELAVRDAHGRNEKAIGAMLDLDALRNSENQQEALKNALEMLKQEHGYLFEEPQTPPPYAGGTGTQPGTADFAPVTLAGALRQKFERK